VRLKIEPQSNFAQLSESDFAYKVGYKY